MGRADADDAAVLIFADMTKFGKLSNLDLNNTIDYIKKGVSRLPGRSVAIVVAPYLIAAKSSGLRGEMRRGSRKGLHLPAPFLLLSQLLLRLP